MPRGRRRGSDRRLRRHRGRRHSTRILGPIPPLLVDLNDEPLEDVHVVSFARPTAGPDGRGIGQPRASGDVVATATGLCEALNLGDRPAAHGERLAAVGNRSVTGLAHVTDERLVLHADGAETKLLLGAALGASGVGR